MIPEELRNFIEQNCSGKEPSDLIMEAIGQKIEQLGADADEVLAFVEECAKGPTLEQKEAEKKRNEKERLTFIGHLEKRLAEIKSDDMSLYKNIRIDLEAEIKKAKSVYSSDSPVLKIVCALEVEKAIADKKLDRYNRNKKLLKYALLLLLLTVVVLGYSLFSGKMMISAKPQTTNDSLIDVRNKFYSCETWQEQLQYVMEPERVRPLMEDYYTKHTYSSSEIKDKSGTKITRIQGKNHILYKVNNTYLVKTGDEYKIDWEAYIARLDSYPILDESTRIPNKEFVYRGYLRKPSWYNNQYYLCYYIDGGLTYPRKNSKIANRLLELMPNSLDEQNMVLKIKYIGVDPNSKYLSETTYQYEIIDILSECLSLY